jgi:fumarylacetoacetase
MTVLDSNHPSLRSWVVSANDPESDFPIQNLPYGRYRMSPGAGWRIGVAIGNQVLDLEKTGLIDHNDMRRLLSLSISDRIKLRNSISNGLELGSSKQSLFEAALLPMNDLELGLPCDVGDYTDFYISIHHATAVGKLFRPDNPLLPNYDWVPIGYHGRSSTLIASGVDFHRPLGQVKAADAQTPSLLPTQRLDFELELGVIIGKGNLQGSPIPLDEAEDHLFGLTLFNDWSARDIQAWEYQPLGPFLGKNFASTVSPWIVTMEALEPFRTNFKRPFERPNPLPYLNSVSNSDKGAFDIRLEVLLQTNGMRQAGLPFERISYSGFKESAYWTVAQLVTHHTVNGCALRPGDLLGTGTLSGPLPQQAGSMLELSNGGKKPIALSNAEQRTFLQDGDTIALKAWCEKPGAMRIGFGECLATVLPTMEQH